MKMVYFYWGDWDSKGEKICSETASKVATEKNEGNKQDGDQGGLDKGQAILATTEEIDRDTNEDNNDGQGGADDAQEGEQAGADSVDVLLAGEEIESNEKGTEERE